jgi:hypothetical protein
LLSSIYSKYANIEIKGIFYKQINCLEKDINIFLIRYGKYNDDDVYLPLVFILDIIYNFNFLVFKIKCKRLNLKISSKILDNFLVGEKVAKRDR